MTKELRKQYEEVVKKLMEDLAKFEPGTKEYNLMVAKIDSYQKSLNDADRIEQEAFDNAESRKIEAAKIESQSKADKIKARYGFLGAVVGALGGISCALMAFAGLKSNQRFVYHMENESTVYKPKGLDDYKPRLPWGGK